MDRERTNTNSSHDDAKESEVLTFRGSDTNTLGVEIELQIIDPETGDLAPGAVRILKACEQENLSGVSAELMQSMIEVKTGICHNVVEVEQNLFSVLRRLRNVASSLGYNLALGATHPFDRGLTGVVFPTDRYKRIENRLAWVTYQRLVFGLHVHVGVPSGDMAMGVISMLVQYLPHLLALSASSPFWHGMDTGLASCRSAVYRMLPHAGVPRYFRNWKEFRSFFRVMRDCRAIQSPKDIYWDIRPSPTLGTVEIRVCDMPLTLETTLGIAALIHCLVINTQRLLTERPQLIRGDIRRHWVAIENKWLATRYGMQAMYLRSPSGKRRPLSLELSDLIERMQPIADELGDGRYLRAVRPGETFEAGSARQRRMFRETGNFQTLIDDITQRWVIALGTGDEHDGKE